MSLNDVNSLSLTKCDCEYHRILTSPRCVLQTCDIFFHPKRPSGILFVQLADRTFIIPEGLFTI